MFLHLHTYSYFSFLRGLASPAELARAAAQNGMEALALTDHVGMSGAVEFYTACLEAGVRPILGLELEVAAPAGMPPDAGSLVLLAMDSEGWASLCRLSSAAHTHQVAEQAQAISFEMLASETQGLLCVSGGRAGLATQLLLAGQPKAAAGYLGRLAEVFPDRLYVELQMQSAQEAALAAEHARLAQGLSLPILATNPVYYLAAEQANLQRLATAIRLNRTLSEIPAEAGAPSGSYFTTPVEMAERFSIYPAAIAATREAAGRCQLELRLDEPRFPEVPLPSGVTALEALRQKAEVGAVQLYGKITPEIQDRLDYELAMIGESGYTPLFLVMEEVLRHARQKGVPVSSRGSAASSLVAHCLGISSPDPLRLNLYFERFLNPARTTPPDIDTDLCSRRRDEVIRFVYQRYGAERVAMVSTVNRFRRRLALREAAKACGLSPAEIKTLIDQLPYRWWGPRALAADEESPYAELAERYPAGAYQTIFDQAAALIGIPRHLSIHPGGVVIAPGALTDLVPIQMAAKGVVITQFDLESIARLGLVKIDLLGIRGLTVLGDVAEAIQARDPNRYTASLEALESIPEEDVATANLVQAGKTIGCFQIESPGMRATLKEIQARSVDDIMVALALYRPGPLTGGLKEAFVRRHRREEQADYLHPALEPLLADTYGVILYQEQVLRITHELAGLSLADADLLRRAMSHFDPGEQMRTLKEKFVTGALAHSGVPQAVGERIWQLMAAFAGYGFPKAHAASYAQVAWRAAWCKTHEPAVFIAAVLANWGGYYGQRVYLMEARRMGLAVRAPHINHAGREFSVRYLEGRPVLFMGLDQVRDLTRRAQVRILNQRPFHSLADFLARVDPRPAEAENLIQAGALEGFGTIPTLLGQLKRGWRGGQLPLFELDATRGIEADEDWSLAEKMAAQETILGVGVVAHPLELVARQLAAAGTISTLEAAARLGQRVRVAGIRQTWQRSRTGRLESGRMESGRLESVYIMALEDLDGMIEVVIPSDVFKRYRPAFSGGVPFVIEGEVMLDEAAGEPFIRAEKAWRLE